MARTKSNRSATFRVGRVKGFQRGQVWYLYYFEEGRRRRPRIGTDLASARQMAAQINSQLEVGAPTSLSFEPVSIPRLRESWLRHHEQVRRSSLATLNRYRTATEHVLRFLEQRPIRLASHFRVAHAEEFVAYLRSLRVAPNGHAHSAKRPLLDKGILFILETCRALFVFATKRRHLPPYAENPFSALELGRMPVDHRRPIHLPTSEQTAAVLSLADDWSFPIFVTLAFTGMRPGELVHLLIEDFDLQQRLIHVRNRPSLGWQVKTRQDRTIPLLASHATLLQRMLADRRVGTLFLRQKFSRNRLPQWAGSAAGASNELTERIRRDEEARGQTLSRQEQDRYYRQLWVQLGLIKTDMIRNRLRQLSQKGKIPELATPKIFRHLFATTLQEGRVDPLIRNELLGHIPEDGPRMGGGLGMTANYTHTRLETKRAQLEAALAAHPILNLLHSRQVGQRS